MLPWISESTVKLVKLKCFIIHTPERACQRAFRVDSPHSHRFWDARGCLQKDPNVPLQTPKWDMGGWLFLCYLYPNGPRQIRRCRRYELAFKGALTLGKPYHAWACLTPKVQFVWPEWALCSILKHGTLCRPWHSWKRWTLVRYRWRCTSTSTERRHHCDSLWRIHLKFRQTAAYNVRIKSSGKNLQLSCRLR